MNELTISNTIKDSYIYGYPFVGMYQLLYQQILDPVTKISNLNEFSHTFSVSSPTTSFVPAPNNDTLYSRAWLDLRDEPVVIQTPDTKDRFYTIQLLDLFSETISNFGKRLYGTKANTFLLVGPTFDQELPQGFTVLKSNTTFALAFLRILIQNESEVELVKQLQDQFKIQYLSDYLSSPLKKERSPLSSLPLYKNQNYREFFETLNSVLLLTPKLKQDDAIWKKLNEIGIENPSSATSYLNLPEDLLNSSCEQAIKLIDEGGLTFGESDRFWRIARNKIGNYGTDYLQRSVVWFKGALANQPEESLYPSTFQDSNGEILDGNFCYELKFAKGELPPVSQFWSLTMYRFSDGFLTENEINRYSIGDRTKGLEFEEDGSLILYLQNQAPQTPKEKSNWLPAPKEKFFLTLRLYGPSQEAIEGTWSPPFVEKK